MRKVLWIVDGDKNALLTKADYIRAQALCIRTTNTWLKTSDGQDDAACRRLAPETNYPPSLAERSLCRHIHTQGGSRMWESRTYGSVRGARCNSRPYRIVFG